MKNDVYLTANDLCTRQKTGKNIDDRQAQQCPEKSDRDLTEQFSANLDCVVKNSKPDRRKRN